MGRSPMVIPDNVTRIHPAPSLPNPLTENPWAALTHAEIEDGIFRAEVRIDAAQHTLQSLLRERARRLTPDGQEAGQ